MPPLRNLPLPSKVLQDSQFLSLQERMAKDLFAFDAEQRKESDALSLERIGGLQLPEDGGITGTTGYESMLGDTEASGADESGGMAPEAPDEYAAPTTQPRRAAGLMAPTLDMPAMSQPQRRQAVYDPTSTIDIQGEPDYDPSQDTGTVFSGPTGVTGFGAGNAVSSAAPTIAGKFPEEQARIYQQGRASGLDDEGARVLVAVSETEGGARGAVGDNGRARGVYQFHDQGEFPSFVAWTRRNGIEGDPAALAVDPEVSTRYAAEGYLGQAIKRGRELGYSGAELATYVQRTGQRSVRPETTGENYTRLFGQSAPSAPVAAPSPAQRAAESRAQTGETRLQGITPPQFGLGDADADAICGPVLAMAFATSNGRNPTIAEAKQMAATHGGWTSAQGMGGPEAMANTLRQMGIPASYRPGPLDIETIRRETANGNPVGINTQGHYFVVEGVDQDGRLDLGNSAKALRASGGRQWFRPEEIPGLGMGAPTGAIYKDSPSSPAPSVAVREARMPTVSGTIQEDPTARRERDALALTADLPSADSPLGTSAGGPTPAGVSELDQARATTGGGELMARNPLDVGVPVRDRWADEPQVPYDPDQGPREMGYTVPGPQPSSGPGSVGVAAGSEQARPVTAPSQATAEEEGGYQSQQRPQVQISQGGPPTPSAQWTLVETAPPRQAYVDPDSGPREATPGSAGSQPVAPRPQYSGPSYSQPTREQAGLPPVDPWAPIQQIGSTLVDAGAASLEAAGRSLMGPKLTAPTWDDPLAPVREVGQHIAQNPLSVLPAAIYGDIQGAGADVIGRRAGAAAGLSDEKEPYETPLGTFELSQQDIAGLAAQLGLDPFNFVGVPATTKARGLVRALVEAVPGVGEALAVGDIATAGIRAARARVGPAIGRVGYALAEEGARQLMDLTPSPRIVPPGEARRIGGPSNAADLRGDYDIREAVRQTPGMRIVEDGVEADLRRFQQPEQAGEASLRGGVSYTPNYRSTVSSSYRGNRSVTFGGPQEMTGPTVFTRPLAVRGQGQESPAGPALIQLLGDDAAQAIGRDIADTLRPHGALRGTVDEQNLPALTDDVAALLERNGIDGSSAPDLVRTFRRENQLVSAIVEQIAASKARGVGYDSIIGYGEVADEARDAWRWRVYEVTDLREATYPTPEGGYTLRPEFQPPAPDDGTQMLGSGVVPESRRMYHGTAGAFGRPDPGQFDPNGLFGPGYYLTSDPRIAGGVGEPRVVGVNPETGRTLNADGTTYTTGDPSRLLRAGYAQQRAIGNLSMDQAYEVVDELLSHAMRQRGYYSSGTLDTLMDLHAELSSGRMAKTPGVTPQYVIERAKAILSSDNPAVDATVNEIAGRVAPGANVRAVDVPSGLRMLDVDAPIREQPGLLDEIEAALGNPEQVAAFRNAMRDQATREIAGPMTVNRVYSGLEQALGNDKAAANQVLAAAGYDGITHAGGRRIPMRDKWGDPIEHDVNVVFPGSLDKITNAFSGEAGGSGVVPRLSAGLRADAFNAAQGGVMGAASEDLQAQQEGRDADPAERARRALIGGGLAVAGGRYARPAAARALGSGVVPSRRMYHGTAGAFAQPDPGKFDPDGLFGPGYYLTSDPRVAGSYADQRGMYTALEPLRESLTASRQFLVDSEARIAALDPDMNSGRINGIRQEMARVEAAIPDIERQIAQAETNPSGPNVRAVDVPSVSTEPRPMTRPKKVREFIDTPEGARLGDEIARAGDVQEAARRQHGYGSPEWQIARDQADAIRSQFGPAREAYVARNGEQQAPRERPSKNLHLLDMDGPISADAARRIDNGLTEWGLEPAADGAAFYTGKRGDEVYESLMTLARQQSGSLPADEAPAIKQMVNDLLHAAGFDGMQHRGGRRVPMMDDAGNPIEHDVTIVFPESLTKITNAFSGEAGGSGVVPRLGTGLRADAFNAAQGGVMGAASEDLQAQQEGREPDPGERARRGVVGAGLAVAGGRYARRGPVAERALGSGVVPEPGRGPQRRAAEIPGQQPIKLTPSEEVSRLRLDKFPEEVRDLIQQSAGEQGYVHAQRRGVLPDAVVQQLAQSDAKPVDDLIKGSRAGKQYSAEETLAVRNAVASQATVVRELSEEIAQARANNMTPDLLIARRAAEATKLNGLVQIAEGARAEAGRTLRAYRQQAELIDLNPQEAIQQIYKRLGGKENAEEAVDTYTKLVQDGADPIKLAKFWAKVESGKITGSDLFSLFRRFNMLSGPRTLEVNALSGAVNLGYEVASQALGQAARGRLGEAAAEVAAPFKAMGRAFGNMAETMWHGVSAEQAARGDIPRNLSARTDNRAAKAALTVAEVPDRLNAGVDQFFRTMTEDWAATRLAQQQARDANLTPRSASWSETVAKNLETIREDPSKFPQLKEIADHVTFSEEPGPLGQGLEALRRKSPLVMNVLAPFIRTPYNIASRAVDLSPLGVPRTAIEALTNKGRGRANISRRVRDNTLGVAAAYWAYDQAQQGNLTGAGPDDPEKIAELRAQGWQPYSVRIKNPANGKDEYWSYANFAPFSLALSSGAAAAEAQKYAKPGATDTLSMLADGAGRTAKVVTDMTVLAGIGAVVKSIQDPERYGGQWLTQFLQTMIPAGSALNTVGQMTDPTIRRAERDTFGNQVRGGLAARVPDVLAPVSPIGTRQDVPAARQPLGEMVPNNQTGLGALNPFRPTERRGDRVYQAFLDAGVDIGPPPRTMAGKDAMGRQVPITLTPSQQRQYQVAMGQEVRQRMGDLVDALPAMPREDRQKRLQTVLRESREAAADQLSAASALRGR